jgi:hypothetical protein
MRNWLVGLTSLIGMSLEPCLRCIQEDTRRILGTSKKRRDLVGPGYGLKFCCDKLLPATGPVQVDGGHMPAITVLRLWLEEFKTAAYTK